MLLEKQTKKEITKRSKDFYNDVKAELLQIKEEKHSKGKSMKIKIVLADGTKINKNISVEKLQNAEKHKIFKKIDRYNTKTFNNYYRNNNYIFRHFDKDKIISERLVDLKTYLNYLKSI